jgi:hypothetical protein
MIIAEIDGAQARAYEQQPRAPANQSPTAEPGVMRLTAVREKSGNIVDFVCVSGNAAAARMMYCAANDLPGTSLRRGVGGPLANPVLIERYRRVIEHGNAQSFAQVHLLDGLQDIVDHRVMRHGDGVLVMLTNVSAGRRAQERRLHKQAWAQRDADRVPV